MALTIEKIVVAGDPKPAVGLVGASVALAGQSKGFHVTYIPLYGPVILSANETSYIVVSSQEVGSPVVGVPDVLVALTQAAFARFHPKVKAGGAMIYDSSSFELDPRDVRDDLRCVGIPCAQLVEGELKAHPARAAFPILGAYASHSRVVDLAAVLKGARSHTSAEGFAQDLEEAALGAIRRGADYVKQRKYMTGRYRYSIFEG